MIYRFEQYRLDTDRRELSRDGLPIPLRPKVFALLALLVEERERVLERDTLFGRLWPGRFVSDATLSSCVKELRKALGDTGRNRRFIKTIHGQGFRFVSPVVTGEASAERDQAPSSAVPSLGPGVSSDIVPAERDADAVGRTERKRLSALRWAVLDADAVAARLGPEAMHSLMQCLLEGVREVVERYDGQVTQWLSDGCLALFGVPRSHEDDARRALLAARDIHGCCASLREEHACAIACGVTSGVVIVGGVPGHPGQHYSAAGSLVRDAKSLCFAAGEGEIAISDATYRLVRGDVRVQALDPTLANTSGKPGAGAWLVRQIVGDGAGVPRRFRRRLAPLIGRSREMELLAHRLEEARAGAGQAVALIGAAGIGKTRLLEEFRASLDEAGIESMLVRCKPQRRHTIDHVLVGCLHALCGSSATDDHALVAERVRATARAAGIDDETAQALLLGLLEHDIDVEAATAEPSSPRARRELVESALKRLVFAADEVREPEGSRGGVRVLFVEDLHWIDPSSAAWLGRLVQSMGSRRLLLLVTYRTGTQPEWLRYPAVTQVPLSPLAPSDAARLVEALPRPARDEATTARIVASAGGNPFLLSELTLRRDDEQPIPDTVQAVLAARIDELSPIDKGVLRSASALGISTRSELLLGICDADEDDVRDALLRLQGLELLDVEFEAGEERVAFRHALVQEAAHAMLLADERKRLHGRIVALMDRAFPHEGATQPEILALHCEQAGFGERAARLWQRAAWNSSLRCAYVEATRYVERGLALLSEDDRAAPGDPADGAITARPDPSSRSRSPERVELELALVRSLGHALGATHGYASEPVAAAWSRAELLCEELSDDVSLFRVLVGLGDYHLVSGELERVLPINRRLARLARRENSVAMRARAEAAMGELMSYLDRAGPAMRHFERCLALVGSSARSSYLEDSAAVLAHGHLAWTLWSLGEERSALVHGERALGTAHASGKPFLQAMALVMNAELHRFRDDAPRAASLAQAAIDIAARQRFTHWHGFALVTLGWSEARRGDTSAGLATIERGLALAADAGARLLMPVKLGVLAEVQRLHGNPQSARETLARAFELAELTNGRYSLPGLARVRGALGDVQDVPGSGGQRKRHGADADRLERQNGQSADSILLSAGCVS